MVTSLGFGFVLFKVGHTGRCGHLSASPQVRIPLSRRNLIKVESSLLRAYDLTLNQPLCRSLPQLVSRTHLAGPVKKGVVDQKDASLMCSVSQTLTGVPVPQAGGGCSAMKVCATCMGNRGSCSWCPEAKPADISSRMHWIAWLLTCCWMQGFKSQIFLNERDMILDSEIGSGRRCFSRMSPRDDVKHGF